MIHMADDTDARNVTFSEFSSNTFEKLNRWHLAKVIVDKSIVIISLISIFFCLFVYLTIYISYSRLEQIEN